MLSGPSEVYNSISAWSLAIDKDANHISMFLELMVKAVTDTAVCKAEAKRSYLREHRQILKVKLNTVTENFNLSSMQTLCDQTISGKDFMHPIA